MGVDIDKVISSNLDRLEDLGCAEFWLSLSNFFRFPSLPEDLSVYEGWLKEAQKNKSFRNLVTFISDRLMLAFPAINRPHFDGKFEDWILSTMKAIYYVAKHDFPHTPLQWALFIDALLAEIQAFDMISLNQKKQSQLASKPKRTGQGFLNEEPFTRDRLAVVEDVNKAFANEYSGRRAVLIQRLDATLASFKWSGKGHDREAEVDAVYKPMRATLKAQVKHDVNEIFEISASTAAEALSVTRVSKLSSLAGSVMESTMPDRGGRVTNRQMVMPAFTDRSEAVEGPKQPFKQRSRVQRGGKR